MFARGFPIISTFPPKASRPSFGPYDAEKRGNCPDGKAVGA